MSNTADLIAKIRAYVNDRDYRPTASAHQYEAFLEGSILKDFENELLLRIEGLRDVLEVSDTKGFHMTQGAIAFAREQVLPIFLNLYENSLMDMEEKDDA